MLDHPNKICGQVTSTRDFCTYKKKNTPNSAQEIRCGWFAYAFPTVKQRPITIMYLNGTRRCYAVGLTGECVCGDNVVIVLTCRLFCAHIHNENWIRWGRFLFLSKESRKTEAFFFLWKLSLQFCCHFLVKASEFNLSNTFNGASAEIAPHSSTIIDICQRKHYERKMEKNVTRYIHLQSTDDVLYWENNHLW